MKLMPFSVPPTLATAGERFRLATNQVGAKAPAQISPSTTAKRSSAWAIGARGGSLFFRLVLTFLVLGGSLWPCVAQTLVVTVTPCTILTPCNESAAIQISITPSTNCVMYTVTNWTAGPYNWNWDTNNLDWTNSGGTTPDFQFVPSLDQQSATITRSDNAKSQTVKIKAGVNYQYLPYGGINWIADPMSPPIPSIEIADSGGCTPGSSGGGCGSTCALNGSAPALGTANVQNNQGPYVKLNLGAFSYMQNAGALVLDARNTSASLSTPAALYVPFTRTNMAANVTVMTNSSTGVIEQINTPQGLVNVAVMNAYQYQLQMFYSTNVITNSGSLYTTNGPAFVTWTISNPNGSTNTNVLTITENGNGLTNLQYTYTHTNSNPTNQWFLTDSGSNRTVMEPGRWRIRPIAPSRISAPR